MKRTVLVLLGILFFTAPAFADDARLLENAASLKPQSGEGDELKVAFNKCADDVRLMVLLSPT